MADRREDKGEQEATGWFGSIWKWVKELTYRVVTFLTAPILEAAMPIVDVVTRTALTVAIPAMAGIGFTITIAGGSIFVGLTFLLGASLSMLFLGIRLIRHFCGHVKSSQKYGDPRYLN